MAAHPTVDAVIKASMSATAAARYLRKAELGKDVDCNLKIAKQHLKNALAQLKHADVHT